MNLDKFNAMSRSFFGGAGGVSDWGIEETVASPALSHGSFMEPIDLVSKQSIASSTLINGYTENEHKEQDQFQKYCRKCGYVPIESSTENFNKFIKKYLSLTSAKNKFWEEFKYNMVISDLLSQNIVLSKNEQSLKNVIQYAGKEDESERSLVKLLNNDGTVLRVLNRQYHLTLPSRYFTTCTIILVIYSIIFFMKQLVSQKMQTQPLYTQSMMLRILIITSTRIIHCRRVRILIQSSKIMKILNGFLFQNYALNKKLITGLLRLKECEMFDFMKSSYFSENDALHIKSSLQSALNLINLNIRNGITKLLPFVNGPMLEKFCNINDVDIFKINQSYKEYLQEELCDSTEEDKRNVHYNEIFFYISQFHELRKFLICELLIVDGVPQKCLFLYEIWDIFNIDELNIDEYLLNSITFSEKLLIIEEVLSDFKDVLKVMNQTLDNFEIMNKNSQRFAKPSSEAGISVNLSGVIPSGEACIKNLSHAVLGASTKLKYFSRYNSASLRAENSEESHQKLSIFQQLGIELDRINELYKISLNELTNECNESQWHSTLERKKERESKETKNNKSSDFSLKSLHTVNSNSNKKRLSLYSDDIGENLLSGPNMTSLSSPSNPQNFVNEQSKSSRLSGGLPLSLLTVFKELANSETKTSLDSYDETTTRLPFTGSKNIRTGDNINNFSMADTKRTHNSAALDSLNRNTSTRAKSGLGNSSDNRFSLNSLTSNVSAISDFASSSQLTTIDDENVIRVNDTISKNDLVLRLEESLNKIYELESEKHENTRGNRRFDDGIFGASVDQKANYPLSRSNNQDKTFDAQLEKVLENKFSNATQ